MSKIHVWIGFTQKSKEEFGKYFVINKTDIDAGLGVSLFCKDIGISWYDDDLIGVYKSNTTDSLEVALDEIPTSPSTIDDIHKKCIELGINKANAMFYYTDAGLNIESPKPFYNDLYYVGVFDNS